MSPRWGSARLIGVAAAPGCAVLVAAGLLLGAAFGLRDRADAHAPHPGLDFSIAADADGDTVNDCSTGTGEPTTCSVPLGATFRSREYLDALGAIPGYRATQLHFGFAGGVVSKYDPTAVWPGCSGQAFYNFPAYTHLQCGLAPSDPDTSYLGLLAFNDFNCTADGTLDLTHGLTPLTHTVLYDGVGAGHAEGEGMAETLTIDCVPPAPYPTDTDGDGCPDTKESGADPSSGGSRNFYSPWDYFNPTKDGQNRIDDVLAVAGRYFLDEGDDGYSQQYDRSYLGPDPWNLGPPNGQIRIDDVLAAADQYFQDCA